MDFPTDGESKPKWLLRDKKLFDRVFLYMYRFTGYRKRHVIDNGNRMKAEFNAIIAPAPEGGYWAICPEISGTNSQGETIEEAKKTSAWLLR